MSRETLLMMADSERDANMLYAVGMFVPDPFVCVRIKGRFHIVMSDLEIDRARAQARHCRVLSLSRLQRQVCARGVKAPRACHVIQQLLRGKRIKKVRVPESFPFGLARDLRKLRVKLTIRKEPFFPERATKTAEEIKRISGALMMAEVGLAEGLQTLKRAKVGRHRRLLLHHNVPLTAEKLRAIINTAVLQAGGLACHTIVSGGRQSCDPHEEGHGPLRAHEPIILDVFPRSQKTGYYGDITRTIVRGRASEAVRRLYATVAQAQALGFAQLSAQVAARDVHQRVQDFFESQGYKTGRGQGRMRGFFHGTGHGLGLELHEAPYLGATSADVLKPGHVVTVEPGLYYPELGGGVRLEDVAVVTRNGARNLTRFEKTLEI